MQEPYEVYHPSPILVMQRNQTTVGANLDVARAIARAFFFFFSPVRDIRTRQRSRTTPLSGETGDVKREKTRGTDNIAHTPHQWKRKRNAANAEKLCAKCRSGHIMPVLLLLSLHASA